MLELKKGLWIEGPALVAIITYIYGAQVAENNIIIGWGGATLIWDYIENAIFPIFLIEAGPIHNWI